MLKMGPQALVEMKSLALMEGMRALEEEQMLWKPGVQVRFVLRFSPAPFLLLLRHMCALSISDASYFQAVAVKDMHLYALYALSISEF